MSTQARKGLTFMGVHGTPGKQPRAISPKNFQTNKRNYGLPGFSREKVDRKEAIGKSWNTCRL